MQIILLFSKKREKESEGVALGENEIQYLQDCKCSFD